MMSTPLFTFVRSEAKVLLREPSDALIPIGMPLVILVIWGFMSEEMGSAIGEFSLLDAVGIPMAFCMTLTMIALINMPSRLVGYRHSGVLRRLSLTPITPLLTLLAQVLVSVAQAVIGLVLAVAFAVGFFDAQVPTNPLPVIGAVALTTVALYALGMMIASLAPSQSVATTLGLLLFLALGAAGGMFDGGQFLPEAILQIGQWLPFGAGADAVGAAWGGESLPIDSILALTATALIGTLISATTFRWNPR